MDNIWILTEEIPKNEVIKIIIDKVSSDRGFSIKINDLRITPVIKDSRFVFKYRVENVKSKNFGEVFIKIVSGSSSFVDFLVFTQENEPDQNSVPLYAIEETKTDDSESRNTGVYQRCSKFVYIDFYYPKVKKIMLYNLQIPQKERPTQTSIFGTRMLRTIDVEIMGKVCDKEILKPFSSIEELVSFKNSMRMPPVGNVPIKIEVLPKCIKVSGRLYKAGGICHDPNIGALSIIAACIRKWEKNKDILITSHGLEECHLGENNKFIQIASKIGIKLEGLNLPTSIAKESYWHYDVLEEKIATIFLHVSLLAYTDAKVIYHNHGGSERSYFMHKTLGPLAIAKYQEGKRKLYKAGNKKMIIFLPDMIIYDIDRNEIINVEGKKFTTRKKGISELTNYRYIENKIIKPAYDPASISRTVVIFGSKEKSIRERQIGFMLNEEGEIVLGKNAPEIFRELKDKIIKPLKHITVPE